MFIQSGAQVSTLSHAVADVILVCLHAAYKINDSYVSNERKLYHYLMEDYEKTVRPVRQDSDTLGVQLYLVISGIEALVSNNHF
jgi:hypothetical protein